MREYLIIDGVNTSDFGVFMINNGQYTKNWIPNSKIYSDDLPYQNGTRFIDKYYGEKKIRWTCFTENINEDNINTLTKILGKNKQVTITISTEPHKVYKAVLSNEVNIDEYMNGGTFDLEFIVHSGFGSSQFTTADIVNNGLIYNSNYYYNSGLLYDENNDIDYSFTNITGEVDFFIHNGSNISGSKPNIILNGSADDLLITKYKTSDRIIQTGYMSYGSFNGELEINCLLRDTFLDDSVNNLTFDGEYIELDAGEVINVESGGIVDSTGNQIVLPATSSVVDDYYNGYYITLIDENSEASVLRIIDYNGSTKTITLDAIQNNSIDEYSIYNIETGMNYFKIDGTNLNISEMVFDFKFKYL